jgi:hypothetical protein
MRAGVIATALAAATVAFGWGLTAPAVAQQYDPQDEWQGLPEGKGREEVFYNCVACHSMGTIMQQRLSLRWWEITIEKMIDDMGMVEPPDDEMDLILDYLEEHFGQDSPR